MAEEGIPESGEAGGAAADEAFVHLRVHTQYSLLQGAIQVKKLVARAAENEMPAVAITDSNNLFGAIDFYNAASKAGVKPLLGCELVYAPRGRAAVGQSFTQKLDNPGQRELPVHQIVVLCKNLKGYQNLCQLITKAYTNAPPLQKGQWPWTRHCVDRDLLDRYGDDLIVLSGGLKGEIPYLIFQKKEEDALQSALWFKKRFGEDFYFEIQSNGLPEQDHVNEVLSQWGEKHGIPLVATGDCHYLEEKDAEAHEILQCIALGKNLDFDRPKSLVPSSYAFATAKEMRERFSRFPEACANTLKIAEKCNVEFRFEDDEGKPIYHLPDFRPEGVSKEDEFDTNVYFAEEALRGLETRFAEEQFADLRELPDWEKKKEEYYERLKYEVEMIQKTGFSGYFLIVADFIIWAKAKGIPVGPGRGSGAGSIVAYSLKITDIDPIRFNLLFERFINPERISMPDFDVDFCQDRRGEVIDYVNQKYGADRVSQIITFGKLQPRAAVKDVGRVLGFSFAETDQITKLFPDELNITLDSALEKEPRLRELMDSDPKVAKLMDYALRLEGLYRNAGMHAAGVIITEHPIVTYCPLFAGREGDVVTQFDKDFAEAIGLVKFDFLGLKTLTVIDNAVKLVRHVAEPGSPEADFALEKINYEDEKVFALIGSGDTDGVFQVESSGMKDLCSRIQPNSVEDLTAINALYRPGPLGSGMVDDFIDRKHGRMEIKYDLDVLEPILRDTYGVILYQEQVMQIARELAGYSLGQADMLRRAMGKKKIDEMNRHREIFLAGAKERDIPTDKAESIYNLMAKFAEYGFNKSHSAAYAMLTYQTAYLKTYYPAEFMAALMTTEMDNTDKITKYIADARAHSIPVLPPDVNRSQAKFSVEKLTADSPQYPQDQLKDGKTVKGIRFGLEAIKGVGGIAVESILESREGVQEEVNEGDTLQKKVGLFENVLDFCKRVPTRKVNKKVVESLTLAGAFDSIAEVNRASLFASLEGLLEHAGDEQAERELGQASLFDAFSAEDVKLVTPADALFKQEPDWPASRKLTMEKQVVGFYVSGHPMDAWQGICESWLGWNTAKLKKYVEDEALKKGSGGGAPAPSGPPPSFGGGGGGWQRPQRKEIKIAGLIASFREITTRKGTRMAFAQMEDLYGGLELVVFPNAYAESQEMLKQASAEAEAVMITADLEPAEEGPKLLVKELAWVREAHKNREVKVTLILNPSNITTDQLRELKKNLLEHRGKCPVRIHFRDPKFKTSMELPPSLRVTGSPQMVTAINQVFGSDVVRLH